ncbi:MAG: cyanophycinase [Planctomycetes bacterium]|nr:cyanophycinase [Planctomycetota bacterium]
MGPRMKRARVLAAFLASACALVTGLGAQMPLRGALFACGGGKLPDAVRDAFAARAGGTSARVLIVPTASEDAARPEEHESFLAPWRRYGFASLEILHASSRDEANDERFVARFGGVTAVWLSGGVQSRLIATYGGTLAAQELRALLARGGVIGGTSAGCASMTTPMIAGGKDEPEIEEGFGWLPGAIFDQHFVARGRDPRLARALELHPGHVGFGVDEGTALWIEGSRGRVLGASCVVARLAAGADRPAARVELPAGSEFEWIAWIRAARARAGALRLPAPRALFVAPPASHREAAHRALRAAAARRPGVVLSLAEAAGEPLGTDLSQVSGIWIERPSSPTYLLDLLGDPSSTSALGAAIASGLPIGAHAEVATFFRAIPASIYGDAARAPLEGDLAGLAWIEEPTEELPLDAWYRGDHALWVRGDPEIPRDLPVVRTERLGSRAHAHNDYARDVPLHAALDAGVGSLEVDVFALHGELRVGHTRLEAWFGPRLRELYLEPLAARIAANGGQVYADGGVLHLLVDFKAEGALCLELLERELAPHRAWLTRFAPGRIDAGATTIVISGDVPRAQIAAQSERWWAIDGRPRDLESNPPPTLVPWISAAWSAEHAQGYAELARRAHAQGRRLRFWAIPADESLWRAFLDAGVDWVNVDDPAAYARFAATHFAAEQKR